VNIELLLLLLLAWYRFVVTVGPVLSLHRLSSAWRTLVICSAEGTSADKSRVYINVLKKKKKKKKEKKNKSKQM